MSVEDILKILDSIAKYIVYFYPGYLTIYIYYFLKAKTLKDDKGIIVKSVVLSFLYKILLDKAYIESEILYHFWMICISIIVPYIGYSIQKSDMLMTFFELYEIPTSFEDNEIDMLDNSDISPWLKIYIKNEQFVYEGFLGSKELEDGKRRFISLKKYRKYILDEYGRPQEPYIENHDTDDDEVVIFYDEIKLIEKNKIKEKE